MHFLKSTRQCEERDIAGAGHAECLMADACEVPSNNRGFTMVELLIVIGILAVLAILSFPAGARYVEGTKIARSVGDLHTMNSEIQAYNIEKGTYPGSLNDIGRGGFLDPWGQQYQYTNIDAALANGDPNPALLGSIDQLNSINDYDLWSKGKDTLTSVPAYDATCEDDIVRASDGTFFGLRADF